MFQSGGGHLKYSPTARSIRNGGAFFSVYVFFLWQSAQPHCKHALNFVCACLGLSGKCLRPSVAKLCALDDDTSAPFRRLNCARGEAVFLFLTAFCKRIEPGGA